ncbi:MAG: ABC transporter permease [Anaerolineae bacterium]
MHQTKTRNLARRIHRGRQLWAASFRRFREGWAIFAQNRIAAAGLVLLAFFILLPAVYPVLRATAWNTRMYDPSTGFDQGSAPHPAPPSWIPAEWLAPENTHRFDRNRPSFDHFLGTDTLGRDVLSVLLASTISSSIVGVTAALTTAVVGTLIAAYSAFYRGLVDSIFSHLSDAFLLLPPPIFMIAVGAFLRSQNTSLSELAYRQLTGSGLSDAAATILQPAEFGIIYGIIAGAGGAAIVLRSHGIKVMSLSFIEASRVAGASGRHIIWRHLIPHMMPLASVYMLVAVTGAVVADGFLAFLGINPTLLNWGTMIYYAFAYQGINQIIPWNALIAPAIIISLFAATFYMISRGLLQVFEPRLRDDYNGRK